MYLRDSSESLVKATHQIAICMYTEMAELRILYITVNDESLAWLKFGGKIA